MKLTSSLLMVAFVTTASLAHGEPPVNRQSSDYDFSGKALQNNPALLAQINQTLITGAGCRSMAELGYGNGYQCPTTGLGACMTMLKAGQVDACAALTGRDYPAGCNTGEASSPAQRATSTCADLSSDMWSTLAINIPFPAALKRLQAFGCTAETGNTVFCHSHLREWLCLPFQRGGVVNCRPPKVVKQCTGGEFPQCRAVET